MSTARGEKDAIEVKKKLDSHATNTKGAESRECTVEGVSSIANWMMTRPACVRKIPYN